MFFRSRLRRIAVAAKVHIVGADSARSTMAGRWRNSSPEFGLPGPPVSQKACCGVLAVGMG